MSEVQKYLDSLDPDKSLKLIQDLLSIDLRKQGFSKFKIPRPGTYKLCINGVRLQIVISCTFKSNKYVKESTNE